MRAGDTSSLEADNGLGEDCLNLNVWAPKRRWRRTAALDIVRRPKTTPVHELDRYMRSTLPVIGAAQLRIG